MGKRLAPRLQAVADLAATGMTNKAIGGKLGLTENTVKIYLHYVFTALHIESRYDLIAFWFRQREQALMDSIGERASAD